MATDTPDLTQLELDTRTQLPAEWLALLARHPRESWPAHPRIGMTAQFWLERHAAFRQLGAMLEQATQRFLGGGFASEDFQNWFAPASSCCCRN